MTKQTALERPCSRCAATGTTPFRPMNGRCYKCGGLGRVLTAAGQREVEDFMDEHTVSVLELEVGDAMLISERPYTITALRRIEYTGFNRHRKGELVTVVEFSDPRQNQAFEAEQKVVRL